MRAQSTLALTLWLTLAGCTTPTPGLTPGPRPITCLPIEEAIVGVWQREGSVEEFRGEGTYVVNTRVGAYRWLSPGHGVLDVDGRHIEIRAGLTDVNELIVVDARGVGRVYGRISPAPSIPATCYDLSTSIVGTWLGGPEPETFEREGIYRVGVRSGSWTMPANGHLTIVTDAGTRERLFAQLSDTTAMSFAREEGAQATFHLRSITAR